MARPDHFGDSSRVWNQINRALYGELGLRIPLDALVEIRRLRGKRGGKQGNTEVKTETKILLAIRAGLPWQHSYGRSIEYIVPHAQGGRDELENIRLSEVLR